MRRCLKKDSIFREIRDSISQTAPDNSIAKAVKTNLSSKPLFQQVSLQPSFSLL